MATTTSFKQQCPSCEAMVPIRDANLVGKKIDCPKCKYRFVVEEPADAAGEEGSDDDTKVPAKGKTKAKPGANGNGVTSKRPVNGKAGQGKKPLKRRDDADDDEEDAAPRSKGKKSSGGGSNMMLIGGGLAALVVVLLVVAGIFAIMSSKSKPPETQKTQEDKPAPPPEPAGPGTPPPVDVVDARNLLPNDTELVVNINIPDLRQSPLGVAAFETAGAFKQASIDRRLGFPLKDMERVVIARGYTNDWLFVVVRTKKEANEIKAETVIPAMRLSKPAEGEDYYLMDAADVQTLSVMFQSRPGQPIFKGEPVAVRIHDPKTLVVANESKMKEFVKLIKEGGVPKHKSQEEEEKKDEKDDKGPGGPMPPPGGPMPPPGGPMPPPGGPMPPPGGPMPPGGFPGMPGMGRQPEQIPVSDYYTTVKKSLKTMLDRMEYSKDKVTVVFSLANDMKADPGFIKDFTALDKIGLKRGQVQVMEVVGLSGHLKGGLTCNFGFDFEDAKLAERLEKELRKGCQDAAPILEAILNIKFTEEGSNMGFPGMPPGFVPPGGFQPGQGQMGQPMFPPQGQMGQPQFPPQGQMGQPQFPPQGQMGQPQFPPQGQMGQPQFPPQGQMGQPMFPPAGQMGQPMFPGGPGGPFPGGPGMPGGPGQQQNDDRFNGIFKYRIPRDDHIVSFHLDGTMKIDTFDLFVRLFGNAWVDLKGHLDMATRQPSAHELAVALHKYTTENKQFPRGALIRPMPRGRLSRAWRPDERLSWMVELLPYLDHKDVYDKIKQNESKAWRDREQWDTGFVLVAEFINPESLEKDWWVTYPGLHREFRRPVPLGATHFVGMAGVGLDAADYQPGDPDTAAKIGIFGYDRETKLADIKAPDRTIAVIQVPALYKTPWIAGGGSTVRSAPEAGSVQPFVSTRYNGRPGTYAIMADGGVRFVYSDIPDPIFKAMCTLQGASSVTPADLQKYAPVVGGKVELKGGVGGPPAAPSKEAPPPPAPPGRPAAPPVAPAKP